MLAGTYAGQFVMEGFLSLKIRPWKRVAITRTAAMLPTLMVTSKAPSGWVGADGCLLPQVALFSTNAILNQLNEWMNVLQSFQVCTVPLAV
jgi:natural resistance-associated macrophage protein